MFFRSSFTDLPGVTVNPTCEAMCEATCNPPCEALEFEFYSSGLMIRGSGRHLNLTTPTKVVYYFNNYKGRYPGKNIDIDDDEGTSKFPCNLVLQGGADGVLKYFTINVTSTGFAGCSPIIELVSPSFFI